MKYKYQRVMFVRAIQYWIIGLIKMFFCKINRPILSPSLGGACVHCHKRHLTQRVPDAPQARSESDEK